MSTARAIVTKTQLEQAYQAALHGYTKTYGQVHETPDGKFCWHGRLIRAIELAGQEQDEVSRKRMTKAIDKMTELAEKDFIDSERAAADYKDLCTGLGIQPQELGPVECQCKYCQEVPGWAIKLFADEASL